MIDSIPGGHPLEQAPENLGTEPPEEVFAECRLVSEELHGAVVFARPPDLLPRCSVGAKGSERDLDDPLDLRDIGQELWTSLDESKVGRNLLG